MGRLFCGAGDLEDQTFQRRIEHVAAKDVGQTQRLDPFLAGPLDPKKTQLTLHGRSFGSEVKDLVDRDDPAELRDDLVDDVRRSLREDSDAAAVALMIDLGHREALDIVAAPGKQADDAGEDAGLVLDQYGEGVVLDQLYIGIAQVVGGMACGALGDLECGHGSDISCQKPAKRGSEYRRRSA